MGEHICSRNKTIIHNGRAYTGCEICLPSLFQKGNIAAFNRRWQQVQYRKELMQPNQQEYARAYPGDFRKRHGDDLYRLLG